MHTQKHIEELTQNPVYEFEEAGDDTMVSVTGTVITSPARNFRLNVIRIARTYINYCLPS